VAEKLTSNRTRHVFIIGARSIGLYGGFESFVLNMLQLHENEKGIQYHVTCKASGSGYMDINSLPGAVSINDREFIYCNAHCMLIPVPDRFGTAQAVYYDLTSLKWACEYIERHHIFNPVVYFLAPRIGSFGNRYIQRIREASGMIFQNPSGNRDGRGIFKYPVRSYKKSSERTAIRNANLVICDSKLTESRIKEEYKEFKPNTTVAPYGSYVIPSFLADDDPKYIGWLKSHNLTDGQYYICVGNYAEENNFEAIIREFIRSNSDKDLAIITTDNPKYDRKLQQKLEYKHDKRIKFVGTVYDQDLLNKIRANAYGCIYGPEGSRTDQLLLEALGTTDLNLLLDADSYRDAGGEAAFYWSKEYGNLAELIDKADKISAEERSSMGEKAKRKIREEYSWEMICRKYENLFSYIQ
jgi:rhamnosyltransferase